MTFRPGDLVCAICGKPIRRGDQMARVKFNLAHAECVEAIEDADYADYVNGLPSS